MKHCVQDVLRPIECERHMISKFRQPDFKDSEFPQHPSVFSAQQKTYEFTWDRHHGRNINFGKYIDPNDIRPGTISSPEFLSILACLAEKEQNVKRIIEDQKVSQDGFYMVRVNIGGVWRYIFVDDYIPMQGPEPAGACSYPDQEIDAWVALTEKAYAKAYNSNYGIFEQVISHEHYLRDLTGAPIQTFQPNDPDVSLAIR